MSTRCQIGFYENDMQSLMKPSVLIYRHYDGYPGTPDGTEYGVLADLIPFLQKCERKDVEYQSAWLVYHLIDLHVKHNIQWKNETASKFKLPSDYLPDDGRDYLGHGICQDFHSDIEYFYAIHEDRVDVYSTPFDFSSDKEWSLVGSYNY